MLVRVRAKIEIEFGDADLYHAPHRLAAIGCDLHQLVPRQAPRRYLTKIAFEQGMILLVVETVMHRKVSEVERGVAHARVFPIENANRAIIKKILIEQIVVTEARREWVAQKRGLNLAQSRHQPIKVVGERDVVPPRNRRVIFHGTKGRERTWNRGQRVDALERLGDAANIFRLADLLAQQRATAHEPRNEIALGFDKVHDFRRDADARRGFIRRAFVFAVDTEQRGILAADAQDERLAADIDAEILVGDSAAERRGFQIARAAPHRYAREGLIE